MNRQLRGSHYSEAKVVLHADNGQVWYMVVVTYPDGFTHTINHSKLKKDAQRMADRWNKRP